MKSSVQKYRAFSWIRENYELVLSFGLVEFYISLF